MARIVQRDAEVLREHAQEVAVNNIHTPEVQAVIANMKKALHKEPDGVAIAAPQIGVPFRIFVIAGKAFAYNEGLDSVEKNDTLYDDRVFINPVLVKTSQEKEWLDEGCLSVRWAYGEVERAKKATIEALDETGRRFRLGSQGLIAQIFQHEIDHLNGVLFTDKARNVQEVPPESGNAHVEKIMTDKSPLPFVFFGTPDFSVTILDELEQAGLRPSRVVTAPDKPHGRGLVLTPSPVKVWALKRSIPVLQPQKLNEEVIADLCSETYNLFVVASYGKIIPQAVLDIPRHGCLNVHPSLLPKYRGASPLQSQILAGEEHIGTTIMLMDKDMDHGPLLAQQEIQISDFHFVKLSDTLAHESGKLLADVMRKWVRNAIEAVPQDHDKATFTKKITKEDELIDLSGDPLLNYRKILALSPDPSVYFMHHYKGKPMRVKILDAEYHDGLLVLKKVVPEGRKEMTYAEFERNFTK